MPDYYPFRLKTPAQMKFTKEDVDFLDSLNSTTLPEESRIYLTAQHGYMRSLDSANLKRIEAIYKSAFDPKFVMCYYCRHEIMKIVIQVYRALDKQKAAEAEPELAYMTFPDQTPEAPTTKPSKKK